MRARLGPYAAAILMLSLLVMAPLSVSARSVHATHEVDIFPNGEMNNPADWALSDSLSFVNEPAEYTEAMLADGKLSFVHSRPTNFDEVTFWAQNSPTNSNASRYAPDQSWTYSTGPDIDLDTFDVASYSQYEIHNVTLMLAIGIPGNLYQDSVRISIEFSGVYELVRTFRNTQSAEDYINNPPLEIDLDQYANWTWNDISGMLVKLDYNSVGSTDDTQLNVDAVGIKVKMQSDWYGGEKAIASSSFTSDLPLNTFDLSQGEFNGMANSDCGLEASQQGASGEWISEPMQVPAEQRFGRLHYFLANESNDDVSMSYATSLDGQSWSSFTQIDENVLVPDADWIKIKLQTLTACIEELNIDINDPTMSMIGSVIGGLDGLDETYSRWIVMVNGEAVSNLNYSTSHIAQSLPVGKYLRSADTSIELEVRAFFTWNSDGSPSTTILELSSIDISGGYSIEWDEDPTCLAVGDQQLSEDGGGIILPFRHRCEDDRTVSEDLIVTFENSNSDIVTVDLTGGDIRIALVPEASGQSVITTTVLDQAGNSWSETFTVTVDPVDDAPELSEFPALVLVEHQVTTTVPFTATDSDSSTLTASTNRSWAEVDMTNKVVIINAPTVGFQSIEVNLCDYTSCTTRILDIEVVALPDLVISSIEPSVEAIVEGEVISFRVFVRNVGFADATEVSIRCEADGTTMDIDMISHLGVGEVAAATCNWQVPEGDDLAKIVATVDRGEEITEGDEENNEGELIIEIESKPEPEPVEPEVQISQNTVYGVGAFLLIIIIGLYAYFAPPGIKKIE